MKAIYILNKDNKVWWCNVHQRRATHILTGRTPNVAVCDPCLPGIMLFCSCVDLTNICEIWDTKTNKRII